MIFVSVGQQRPFERLRLEIEKIANSMPEQEIIFKQNIDKKSYLNLLTACDIFIAHAGVGSFLDALQFSKKTILIQRIKGLDPCNTDHQSGLIEFVQQNKIPNIRCCPSLEKLESIIRITQREESSNEMYQNPSPFPYAEIRILIDSIIL